MGKVFGLQLFFVLQYCSWPLEYIAEQTQCACSLHIDLIKDLVFFLQDVAMHAMAIV